MFFLGRKVSSFQQQCLGSMAISSIMCNTCPITCSITRHGLVLQHPRRLCSLLSGSNLSVCHVKLLPWGGRDSITRHHAISLISSVFLYGPDKILSAKRTWEKSTSWTLLPCKKYQFLSHQHYLHLSTSQKEGH